MIETGSFAVDSLLGQQDLYLFNEGSHLRLYEKLGAHPRTVNGVQGRRQRAREPSCSLPATASRGLDLYRK